MKENNPRFFNPTTTPREKMIEKGRFIIRRVCIIRSAKPTRARSLRTVDKFHENLMEIYSKYRILGGKKRREKKGTRSH